MKRWFFRTSAVLLVSLAVGAGFYLRYQNRLKAKSQQADCLAAVIPSVVVQSQQSEIVKLIQQLGSETGEISVAERKEPAETFIFSKVIDYELLRIADLFQNKTGNPSFQTASVASSVDRAISLLKNHPSEYLENCQKLMQECRDLPRGYRKESCLKGLNPKIESLVSQLVPNEHMP